MYSTSIKIIFLPAECRSSAKFPQQLGPRVTDSKLFQAIVHQCTENTKKEKIKHRFCLILLILKKYNQIRSRKYIYFLVIFGLFA